MEKLMYITNSKFEISKDSLIDFVLLLDEHSELFDNLGLPNNPENIIGLFKNIGILFNFDESGNITSVYSKSGVSLNRFKEVIPYLIEILDDDNFIDFVLEDGSLISWKNLLENKDLYYESVFDN